ncbi:20493_t:CDS:2 [Rhizophagus irregularis]|nr:20493_t:CDS:2 [Rhizophagus irregularis]
MSENRKRPAFCGDAMSNGENVTGLSFPKAKTPGQNNHEDGEELEISPNQNKCDRHHIATSVMLNLSSKESELTESELTELELTQYLEGIKDVFLDCYGRIFDWNSINSLLVINPRRWHGCRTITEFEVEDILREEPDFSSIKSNNTILDYGPCGECDIPILTEDPPRLLVLNVCDDMIHRTCAKAMYKDGTLLCSCDMADNSDPLLPFQYSIVDYGATQQVKSILRCAKCSEDFSSCLPPLGFLWFSSQPQVPLKSLSLSTTQKKRTRKPAFTEKSSNKKSKKSKKTVDWDNSPTLQRLIKELSTDNPGNEEEILQTEPTSELNSNSNIFLNLYNKIVDGEDLLKKTTQDILCYYFDFREALKKRYNHYRSLNHGE